MYRTYELTDQEKGKVILTRWDGDTYYYDVFEDLKECEAEQRRRDRIQAEYEKKKQAYAMTLKKKEHR